MANIDEEYVKLTLSNKGIRTNPLDANANLLPDILDKGMLSDLDKHLRAIKQTILSASNFTAYFNENMKKINEVTGEMVQSFFVRKSDLTNVVSALKRKDTELSKGKTYFDFNNLDEKGQPTSASISYLEDMKVEDVKMLTLKRKRAGKIAQSLAGEAVHDYLGGKAYFSSPKDRDAEKMSFDIPVTESDINALGGMKEAKKHYSKILTSVLKDSESTKYSSAETKSRKEDEEEKERKEKEKEKEKKDREEKAESKESRRKTLRTLSLVIASLTAIADIARRILTATLTRVSEAQATSVNAHNLGMSYYKARSFNYQDLAHGLEEGTTMSAISDIQSQFGDATNINDKSLAILARVMGASVSDLVKSGLGGKEPDKLLESILNSYFNNFLNGKNSLGQAVGREQAMRELTTSLKEVSPDIAKIFARMADEYMYGLNKGSYSDYSGFMGLHKVYNSGLNDADFLRFKELGQAVDDLSSKFKNLKDNLLAKLTPALASFISWADKLDIGKSSKEIITDSKEARKKLNEVAQKSYEQSNSILSSTGISDWSVDAILDSYSEATSNKLFKDSNLVRQYGSIVKAFSDKGKMAELELIIALMQRSKKATKESSKTKARYSAIDWSEGALGTSLNDIDLLSKEDEDNIYANTLKNYIDSRFLNGELDLNWLSQNGSLIERRNITYLAQALDRNRKDKKFKYRPNGNGEYSVDNIDEVNKDLMDFIANADEATLAKFVKDWESISNSGYMGRDAYNASKEDFNTDRLFRQQALMYATEASKGMSNVTGFKASAKGDNKLTLTLIQKDAKGNILEKPVVIPLDITAHEEIKMDFANAIE